MKSCTSWTKAEEVSTQSKAFHVLVHWWKFKLVSKTSSAWAQIDLQRRANKYFSREIDEKEIGSPAARPPHAKQPVRPPVVEYQIHANVGFLLDRRVERAA